ncbi:MAG: hypothetical protein ACE14P_08400 [Methanotrichaceae archaeon]
MALAILLILIILRASAEEVLLETQQAFDLDNNTTLVIEDTNSLQAVIWLKLYSRNETVNSTVIRQGGHLSYAGKNITLYKIYSGSNIDLVVLKIENEITNSSRAFDNALTANRTPSSIIKRSDEQIIGRSASQISTAAPEESRSQRHPPFF